MKLGDKWETDPRFKEVFQRFHLGVEVVLLAGIVWFVWTHWKSSADRRGKCATANAKSHLCARFKCAMPVYFATEIRSTEGYVTHVITRSRRTKRGRYQKPATGKLESLIPGMGAVATTLIAGVEAVRRGFAKPIGSMSQMGTIRLGKRTDDNTPLIKNWAPIADLNDIVFTGWDIFGGNLYDAAKTAGVLDRDQLDSMKPFLQSIEPMPAAFDQRWVKRLDPKVPKVSRTVRPRQPNSQRHCGVQDEDRSCR